MIDPESFRRRIQNRLREMLSSCESAGVLAVELDQSRVGRLSRMDAMQQKEMELALSRRQQAELQALSSALRRIDEGRFGDCLECGEPIDPRRLEIDPAATHCIHCAAARE